MSQPQGWTDLSRQIASFTGGSSFVGLGATGDYGSAEDALSPVIPASGAFSIWGPIYLGNLATIGAQLLPSTRNNPVVRSVGWPLAVAHGGAGLWSRTFELHNLPLSLGLVGLTWGAAGLAYKRLPQANANLAEQWMVRVPIGLLFGWLTVAAVAAKTELFLEADAEWTEWTGLDLDPEPLALAAIAGTGALASVITVGADRTLAFPAAVAWGLAGIVVAQVDRRPRVAAAAGGALLGLGAAVLVALARRRTVRRRYDARVR